MKEAAHAAYAALEPTLRPAPPASPSAGAAAPSGGTAAALPAGMQPQQGAEPAQAGPPWSGIPVPAAQLAQLCPWEVSLAQLLQAAPAGPLQLAALTPFQQAAFTPQPPQEEGPQEQGAAATAGSEGQRRAGAAAASKGAAAGDSGPSQPGERQGAEAGVEPLGVQPEPEPVAGGSAEVAQGRRRRAAGRPKSSSGYKWTYRSGARGAYSITVDLRRLPGLPPGLAKTHYIRGWEGQPRLAASGADVAQVWRALALGKEVSARARPPA